MLFDTVDWSACRQLLENLNYVLDGRELDYLLINHLEPDHAACIEEILLRHPKVKVISNEKAFMLMRQFGFHVDGHECIEVKEGTPSPSAGTPSPLWARLWCTGRRPW